MTGGGLSSRERADLERARTLLESPGLAIRMADLIGKPVEKAIDLLPDATNRGIRQAVHRALERALGVALRTLHGESTVARERLHKLAGAASGAVGGFFGLAGLAVELPTTTVIILRSIGEIARSEGHDLGDPRVRLDCLEVLALGGPSASDDAAETGYYATRAGLARAVSEAAQYVAQHGTGRLGAPALSRLLERIAVRFGLVVEEKVALELVPVIGALGGAAINTIFMDHFQRVARGHFILRRLEARHGESEIREAYAAGRRGEESPR